MLLNTNKHFAMPTLLDGWVLAKLYIPSTINTEKELLRTAIWADKKGWFLRDLLVHKVILKC